MADPPLGPGRYHRTGGQPTWYGSSSEAAAWAELFRHTLDPVAASEMRRRIGHADFKVIALDLTSPELQHALGVKRSDLTADDLTICQTLADLAADAGFDAVLGPSAASSGETTLAVFGPAIVDDATNVVDEGARTPTGR